MNQIQKLVLSVRDVRQMCKVWLHDKLEELIDVSATDTFGS